MGEDWASVLWSKGDDPSLSSWARITRVKRGKRKPKSLLLTGLNSGRISLRFVAF